MNNRLAQIPEAFQLPFLDWNVVSRWVDKNVDTKNQFQAWTDLTTDWLESLNAALDNEYQIRRSPHLLMLAPRESDQVDGLLRCGEAGLAEIQAALGSLSSELLIGPIVILLFANSRSYGRYVSPNDPKLAPTRTGGVCFNESYVHIALRPNPTDALQRALLHELTHACLSKLRLPLWLEEGLTQMAEETIVPSWGRYSLNVETARELKIFWQTHNLSEFWWGQSFSMESEAQTYSYELAQVLFRLIAADHKRALPAFLQNAHRDDAGESAAVQFLGKSLAKIAGQFLGDGDWTPVPPDRWSYYQRGWLYLERNQFDEAIRDLNRAVECDPKAPEGYSNRGAALTITGQHVAAIDDLNRALELNPQDSHSLNSLAWIRATSPDDDLRDGETAVEYALKACEYTGYEPWQCLGTLAAAYAEVGEFDEARRWAKESLRQAPAEEQASCSERLTLYKREQPYRDIKNSETA